MLQVVYISTAVAGLPADIDDILAVSRRNNARDDVTGLLYADGRRFLQALEGPERQVEAALIRIAADPRHRAIVTLSHRIVAAREFGAWEMAVRRPGDDGADFVARVDRLIAGAAPAVRGTFAGFLQVRRAA
ncbi:activator of photopigment and puc with BLUF domain protein [Sphingomonas sp. Leaf412]|uniref:BLUF domain-containing protein n=1 Tax=Sphingomonas sp. Leaf412 TaxID=1736370 RepID=UPI0006F338EF|nr:BLUF domain-containing protein [Sphingomonas sp. Leaf412]KQT32963.1 activator of photopigment and puc with BLUF domain protein [Sphingomonas sp. Leaf412]